MKEQLSGPCVLVAEDEGIVALQLRETLTRLGYRVSATVSTGASALEAAEVEPPDIALLDIRLAGGMDGVCVGEEFTRRHIPFVYLTAHSDDQTIQRAALTDPAGYLIKPVNLKELSATMQAALSRARHEQERRALNELLVDERMRLREGLEQMPAAVAIAEVPSGAIVFVNRRAGEMLGMRAGSTVRELTKELDVCSREGAAMEPDQFPLVRAVERGDTEEGTQIVVRRGAAAPRTLLVNAGPVKSAGGVIAAVAAFLDVTDWRLAEEDRLRIQAELERSNRELARFAHAASHDMREPLRTIGAFVGLLRERHAVQLSEGGLLYLGFIETGVARLSRLIDDMLAYARIGAGAVCREVSAETALRTATEGLRHLILETRANIAARPLPLVHANEQLLAKVLQNLIENAIKYRSARTPEIHISAERQGDVYVFRLQDNGIGIHPRYHQEVFAPLRRLHSDGSGTGMGLALCKAMVEQMGGRIWVKSYPGDGSSFYFTLPAAVSIAATG